MRGAWAGAGRLNVSGGLLTTGDLTATNANPIATIAFGISGPSAFGKIVVTNQAELGGALNINFTNYMPVGRTTFDLFDWGLDTTGRFTSTNVTGLSSKTSVNFDDLYTGGTILVILPAGTIITIY